MIVHYKTPELLRRLLDSLGNDSRVNVLVWDNSHADEQLHWVSRHPAVNYHAGSYQNIGYARAINKIGVKTKTPVLAAVNADVDMTSDQAVALTEALMENNEVAVVGPKQRDSKDRIRHGGIFGEDALNDPEMRGWGRRDPKDRLFKDVRDDAVTISGSAYFMKRSVWNEITNHPGHIKAHRQLVDQGADPVGAFLETDHFYEETYFSSFARHLGYKLEYRGDVSITHEWRASGKIGSSVAKKSRSMFVKACDIIGMSP